MKDSFLSVILWTVVLLWTCTSKSANFFFEPSIGLITNSTYNQDSDTGQASGAGIGFKFFGFFSQHLYLGILSQVDSYRVSMTTASAINGVTGLNLSGGPMLGIKFSRIRFWAAPLYFDQFRQQHTDNTTSLKTHMNKMGTGIVMGFGFWIWPNMTVAAEYFFHRYQSYAQSQPTVLTGTLLPQLTIDTIFLNLSFPF